LNTVVNGEKRRQAWSASKVRQRENEREKEREGGREREFRVWGSGRLAVVDDDSETALLKLMPPR